MNYKHTAVAALVALTSINSFAVGPGLLGTVDNLPITISNIVPMGIFQDIYSFTIANPGTLSGNVTAANSAVYNILGLTVTLQDASFAVVGSDNSPSTGFSFGSLAAGSYALNVLGYATGANGGSYNGSFMAQTAPVPEPEILAMMMAGLAALGFMAKRKQQQ